MPSEIKKITWTPGMPWTHAQPSLDPKLMPWTHSCESRIPGSPCFCPVSPCFPVSQVVPEFYNQGAHAAPTVPADRSLWHDPNRRRYLQLGSRERHLCHYCGSPQHFERRCPERDAYDARMRSTLAPADTVARLRRELQKKQDENDDLRTQLERYRSMDQFIAAFQTQASLQ